MDAPQQVAGEADVVVVGGGLAGLTAGAVAARAGRQVVVLDAHRPGGRAATTEHDGVRFNQGAHAHYLAGAGAGVLGRLGITPTGGPPAIGRGSALHAGELRTLPIKGHQLLVTSLLGARGRMQVGKLMAGVARLDAASLADRTGTQWYDELGLRADARAFVSAMARLSSYVADGGADHRAARRPVIGADRVGRLVLSLGRRRSADTTVEVVALNGSHSVVVREAGRPRLAISFDTVGNRIERLYIVVNPAKLGSLDTPIAIS